MHEQPGMTYNVLVYEMQILVHVLRELRLTRRQALFDLNEKIYKGNKILCEEKSDEMGILKTVMCLTEVPSSSRCWGFTLERSWRLCMLLRISEQMIFSHFTLRWICIKWWKERVIECLL